MAQLIKLYNHFSSEWRASCPLIESNPHDPCIFITNIISLSREGFQNLLTFSTFKGDGHP